MAKVTAKPPVPLRAQLRSEFMLDSTLAFLNHGSFGAMPRVVFDEQSAWRAKIEAEPIEILGRRRDDLLEPAKNAIGRLLGMKSENFGLVSNATEGINCVLRSLRFSAGDELLATNHVYNAIRQAMRFIAQQSGAAYREIEIPLPVGSPAQIETAILAGLTPRTKLLVIDHITSPTALLFPIEKIIVECARRNVDVMIDGAHGPGMVPLDIERLAPAYYAGNLHKWVSAPKGSAFIWVRPDKQIPIHPLIVSHFFQQGFVKEFGWQGTRDISASLATPRAIQFFAEFGWDRVRSHNHVLAVWVNEYLCDRWKVNSISPIDGSMLGSMATVPLPPPLDRLGTDDWPKIQQRLHNEFRVEAPIMPFGGRNFIRPCCQIYNLPDDVERLAVAVERLKA